MTEKLYRATQTSRTAYRLDPTGPDTAHLDALCLRLSHERERLRRARKPAEQQMRSVWAAQIEREIADERQRLGLPPDEPFHEMTDDELFAGVEQMTARPDTAAAWFERIRAMVEACDRADTDHKFDAMRTIEESIQGVEVRFGWHKPCAVSPGDMRGRHLAEQPAEYRIILSPHVRIVGELADAGQPVTARLENRDDGEWTVSIVQFAELTGRDATAILLRFAAHFYFGG